jgi:formamidopyrimidine-DNA glycosylase
MPELPEVEVTRLSFAARIAGARVLEARLGKPLRWPLGYPVAALAGRTVRGVRRRGKYLLLDLDLDQGLLLLHLGMSGSLNFAPALPPPGAHDHFDLVTSQGTLRLHDPRRFGAVVYASAEDDPVAQKLLGRLGMEPLDASAGGFDLAAFQAGLKRRQAAIKQVLLAGDLVVGVGNIYASEALFLAGIRPTVRAAKLSRPRAARLHTAIREVLARAVAKGGSTLRDFSSASGETGYFQLEAMVYGREGQPCRVCGTPIKALRQGQRSTFFCPLCQKP